MYVDYSFGIKYWQLMVDGQTGSLGVLVPPLVGRVSTTGSADVTIPNLSMEVGNVQGLMEMMRSALLLPAQVGSSLLL